MLTNRPDPWPPPSSEIPELPVDELALRLLQHVHEKERGALSRANCTSALLWTSEGQGYSDLHVLRAIGEAFDWLAVHGLIAAKPDSSDGWYYVTARGRDAASDPQALRFLRATKRIDLDLHPLLARRVRRQFLLGEYEAAVLLAFREVEIRVRDLGSFDTSEIGVALMRKAFAAKAGKLVNPNLDPGEQTATMELFAGAIGAFKNPSSHRQVDYGDVTVAAEAVLLADLLMRMLDSYDPVT